MAELTARDREHFQRAVELARQAETEGNLPIGAVIVLQDEIVAEGRNAIWEPRLDPSRHAEMEALWAVPAKLKERAPEMTLYSTLEPCLMCRGSILLHHLGRVLYGAADPYGGAAAVNLPPYFQEAAAVANWIGPALADHCDELYSRAIDLLKGRPQTWRHSRQSLQ